MDAAATPAASAAREWYTVAQAVEYTGLSATTIHRAAQSGGLSGCKTKPTARGHWRFRRSDLDAWIERNRVPAARPARARRSA